MNERGNQFLPETANLELNLGLNSVKTFEIRFFKAIFNPMFNSRYAVSGKKLIFMFLHAYNVNWMLIIHAY